MRRRRETAPGHPAPRRRLLAVPVCVLLAALAAGGCAGGGAADRPDATPSEGGTSVTGPTPTDPGAFVPPPPSQSPGKGVPAPSGPPGAMTLTGTVTAGVEANCLLLDGYLLVGGPRDVVRSGARVSVTGRVQADLMTTCQQGIPLVVESARPA